jgi:hypothetical protein
MVYFWQLCWRPEAIDDRCSCNAVVQTNIIHSNQQKQSTSLIVGLCMVGIGHLLAIVTFFEKARMW